ncbi:pentapeptide repeat-containing protein [Micromonospora zamorensis]|uniref:pentapeptide repeat-containing protein n=1 Tax=Micromonospora zamorensis TaxID=709883 RepID=UPI0037A6A556
MTVSRDRFAALSDYATRVIRVGRTRVGTSCGRVVLSLTTLLVGVLALAPSWWWHRLTAVITGPGWRWLPMLLAAAGGIGLAAEAARRWRRASQARPRPVAERVPLFGHVAVLLLMAAVVVAAIGTGMWAALGHPDLAVPGAAGAGATGPGGAAAWSVQNTFDAIKIVLAVVAGIGGVVALTVAYRKQDHGEAAEHRENTKLFNDRFGRAADQLGSGQAAVRLAGVYSLAGLADDWAEGSQTCIDVLCAYLRMPYTPPPADTPPPAAPAPAGLPLGSAGRGDDGRDARQEQQVRHTVLALIREHLKPAYYDDRPRWHGRRFDLRGAVFDGGDLSRIDVTADTVLDLSFATFPSGMVHFFAVRFSGGTVNFHGAAFSGGVVYFAQGAFSGGLVNFRAATFSGGSVEFNGVKFSGGTVSFGYARFSGAEVDFRLAEFAGGGVDLSEPREWAVPPVGVDGSERGVSWPSPEHLGRILKASR